MSEKAHTPTPWNSIGAYVLSADKKIVACQEELSTLSLDERLDNAAFIVEAVNNHARLKAENEAMMEALKLIAMQKHECTLEEPVNWEEVANTFVGIAMNCLAKLGRAS